MTSNLGLQKLKPKLKSPVYKGLQVGRTIGYPTLNLDPNCLFAEKGLEKLADRSLKKPQDQDPTQLYNKNTRANVETSFAGIKTGVWSSWIWINPEQVGQIEQAEQAGHIEQAEQAGHIEQAEQAKQTKKSQRSGQPKHPRQSGQKEQSKQKCLAAAYLGPRTVFHQKKIVLEIFVIDFNQEIYNQTVEFVLLEHIRPIMHFDSLEELRAQLDEDIKMIKIKNK